MDFVEDLVYVFTLHGEQLSPLVFSPIRTFECVSFTGEAPRGTLCFWSAQALAECSTYTRALV